MKKKFFFPNDFFNACEEGNMKIVQELLPIADINKLQPDGFMDDRVHHPAETQHLRVSPFLRAAQKGHRDILSILLHHGADLTKVLAVSLNGIDSLYFSMEDVLRASRAHTAQERMHPVLQKYVLSSDMVDYVGKLIHPKLSRVATHTAPTVLPTSSQKQHGAD